MLNDLRNKRVIITGSTGGIGLATAKYLAKAGAHVTLTSYRQHSDIEETLAELNRFEGSATFHQVDFADDAACERFVSEFAALHGGIDVLINNVGGLVDRKNTDEIDAEFLMMSRI